MSGIKRSSDTEKWGPSEWFGEDVSTISKSDRLQIAQDALKPVKQVERQCPYLSAVTSRTNNCSKQGGVCSVQHYVSNGLSVQLTGHKVAICPSRLVSRNVLLEISKKVLGPLVQPLLVKEVPYSVSLTKIKKNGEPTAAGRIDWLLVDDSDPSRFCAIETQSVYMSGKTQDRTFAAFVQSGGDIAIPPNFRHPDYKSSVPKRLAPQLESKASHLSSTNRKTVVIVDEFVRENMSQLHEVQVPAAYASDPVRAEQHKLNGCEVIFAIVSLNGGLSISEFLYCDIRSAKEALNAVAAMSHQEFENTVKNLVRPIDSHGRVIQPRPSKVFRI